ncbi:MAG: glycosyltransferase [Candidatus Aminicenantes bacterium]|nr:glycosyltransferase [Candidatus Aminicenantes bacterium]
MKKTHPLVSVIMPCYNEEKYIADSLQSLLDDFCLKNCEIIVVDGMSEDGTQDIVNSLIKKRFPIKLFKNEKKLQVHGLNLALSKAKGKIIIRADAHCLYPPGYVKKCVDLLMTEKALNVGGVMMPQGETTVQKAIAFALKHPMGVGDAKWHLGNYSGYVDTVYLGTFRKGLFKDIGLYDLKSSPNEDAELNLRILKAGGKVYLESSLEVIYFPRESLKELAIQYFKYGRGRCYTTLKHRKITSFRQIAPILLVLAFFLSIVLSFFQPLILLFPLIYLGVVFLTALLSWPKQSIPFKQRFLTGLAFLIMHTCWGVGFLSRLLFRK